MDYQQQPFELASDVPKSGQPASRKVPNLKNLRDMIKKNSTTTSQSPSNQIMIKSERTNRNESECSFTLTSDDEKDADGQSIGGRRSSLIGRRSKTNKPSESSAILIQETQNNPHPHPVKKKTQTVQEVKENEEVEDDDQFLKELEEENKLLEEELKSLQNAQSHPGNGVSNGLSGFLPKQIETQRQNSTNSNERVVNPLKRKNSSQSSGSGMPVQRKIRFQDEVSISPIDIERIQQNQPQKSSITPRKDSSSPYTSNRSNLSRNHHKTSRSISSNHQQSLSPKPQKYPTSNKVSSPSQTHQQSIQIAKTRQDSLTNRSLQSVSPSRESFRSGNQHQSFQNCNRDSVHSLSQNNLGLNIQQNGTIDLEKYKSLELRLMGCMRTIKTLEKENQAKQDKISSLQIELDKKTKNIEALQNEKMTSSQSQQRLSVQQSIQSNTRKKEKELELKVKEQDSIICDQKKQMARFQELNKQLIEKVKEAEHQLLEKENMYQTQTNELTLSKKDVSSLKNDLKQMRQEKKKQEYLERECQALKEKYDILKVNSTKFEVASQELYKSHQLMSERLKLVIGQAAERGVLKSQIVN
eukprot:403360036